MEETFEPGTFLEKITNNLATSSVRMFTVFVSSSRMPQKVILFTTAVAVVKDFSGTSAFEIL